MAKTTKLDDIKKRVLDTTTKVERKDKNGGVFKGIITRQDILEVLNYHADPTKEVENVSKFLDSFDGSIIDFDQKKQILSDLASYNVNYSRE